MPSHLLSLSMKIQQLAPSLWCEALTKTLEGSQGLQRGKTAGSLVSWFVLAAEMLRWCHLISTTCSMFEHAEVPKVSQHDDQHEARLRPVQR